MVYPCLGPGMAAAAAAILVNDKDEHDGRSAKRSFDQFNADQLAGEQASNRMGGMKDDGDLSVSCTPFRTVFIINSQVGGLQDPNRMKGPDDADDFSESYILLLYCFCLTLVDFSQRSISSF